MTRHCIIWNAVWQTRIPERPLAPLFLNYIVVSVIGRLLVLIRTAILPILILFIKTIKRQSWQMQSEHYDKEKAIAIMQQQNLKSRFVLFLNCGYHNHDIVSDIIGK
mgnify:CR=1 FL=1